MVGNCPLFVTGGTGYLGRHLIPELVRRGHEVRALVRAGSEKKLLPGCTVITGNALAIADYEPHLRPGDTLVHLVGVPKPNPWKGEQFRAVDLVAGRAAIGAAAAAKASHFIYVSVAHPAPVMQSYIDVRMECEQLLRDTGMNATVLRPWYILGPEHRWPALLVPFYSVAARLPATRDGALRLGLVTLAQMIDALVTAIENPARGVRIVEVPQIRASKLAA